MIEVKTEELKQLESDLRHIAEKSFPFATRHTLNEMAFGARKRALRKLPSQFTLKNKFTERSILVEKVRAIRISQQESAVGSTEDYMISQEFGKVEVAKGRHGVPIPTSFSAGQGRSKWRTKVTRRPNRLGNIKFNRVRGSRGRKQRIVVAMQQAVQSGRRFVFLDLGKRQGIFRVSGGSKRVRRGWPGKAKINMVHDMTHKSVRIPKKPWLFSATDLPVDFVRTTYEKALKFQLLRVKSMRK